MKKVIERIVESPGAPNENDLWLNGKTLKKFQNGEWVAISGGNSGCGEGGESYKLPVASDTQLGGVKVGEGLSINQNGVLSVSGGGSGCDCLSPMIVTGTLDTQQFVPDDDAPSWAEAQNHMFNGGLLYLLITEDGEPVIIVLANAVEPTTIISNVSSNLVLVWPNPDNPDNPSPEPV